MDYIDKFDAPETIIPESSNEIPEWGKVLEPARKLPTNVGTGIRKCAYEALDKGPPEWAKKISRHSISKGNASGSTKICRNLLFRSAVGTYIGSYEAFLEDVREVWHNIRTAYGDQQDLMLFAEQLSGNLESLYEKEPGGEGLLAEVCEEEVLNSAIVREHIDQCAEMSADGQQKLRSFSV
ncbi:hypothetical protein MKW98_016477 [Papaver atlanticum]|uniref:Uncharacterized protein n=1 Tax=Papaver atlanticum TaxID=357466 RepID=A0AAD4XQP3_9MAGN|nr:hypothetical protein MKW98_016477 [Papaver atlanticum]